jgi:hypothetical protein
VIEHHAAIPRFSPEINVQLTDNILQIACCLVFPQLVFKRLDTRDSLSFWLNAVPAEQRFSGIDQIKAFIVQAFRRYGGIRGGKMVV